MMPMCMNMAIQWLFRYRYFHFLQPPVPALPGRHAVIRVPAPAAGPGPHGCLMSVGGVGVRDVPFHRRDALVKGVDNGGRAPLPGPLRDDPRHGRHPRCRGRGAMDGPQWFDPGGCALRQAWPLADVGGGREGVEDAMDRRLGSKARRDMIKDGTDILGAVAVRHRADPPGRWPHRGPPARWWCRCAYRRACGSRHGPGPVAGASASVPGPGSGSSRQPRGRQHGRAGWCPAPPHHGPRPVRSAGPKRGSFEIPTMTVRLGS